MKIILHTKQYLKITMSKTADSKKIQIFKQYSNLTMSETTDFEKIQTILENQNV